MLDVAEALRRPNDTLWMLLAIATIIIGIVLYFWAFAWLTQKACLLLTGYSLPLVATMAFNFVVITAAFGSLVWKIKKINQRESLHG